MGFSGLEFKTRLFGVSEADGQYLYLFGTDNLGRDVYSRMLIGTRVTLLMAFLVVAIAALIGVIVGVCSGYFAGTFDLVTQRFVEFMGAFPDLPLYLALLALLPRRADALLVFIMFAGILVLLRWAQFSREIRGMVISIRGLDYVRAAEAVGASRPRILFRHIVPNTTSQIVVWVTYQLPDVILLESFLSFLGVGVQPPMVSWGSMLNQILDFQSFNAALDDGSVSIILTVLAFNAMGDGLRDAVDPSRQVSQLPMSTNSEQILLKAKDIEVGFPIIEGFVQAVRGVSFEIVQGKTLALVGESGSGKSVTARALMGMLSERAVVGKNASVEFSGEQLIGLWEHLQKSEEARSP